MQKPSRNLGDLIAAPASERRIGAFELVEQLGHGGFAPVWLAREVYEGVSLRAVAVKLFDVGPSGAANESAKVSRSRIVAEAAALCRVEHPNVVRFHTLAIDEERGAIGLVMEYAAGRALSARISEEGELSFDDTLAAGLAVASALAAVHRVGLVHRDVKPQNVIEVGGRYKLIDFGISAAALLGSSSEGSATTVVLDDLPLEARWTKMSSVLKVGQDREPGVTGTRVTGTRVTGTIGYVDPYVVQTGAPSVASSDLYALGALLFECATGRMPAASHETRTISGEILDGRATAPPLRFVRPDLPTRFAVLVDALLRPRPEDRPASAVEVARELEHVRSEWETAKASRRLQLLPGGVLAALRGAVAEAERRVSANDHAAAVDVYAVALRDVLGGPLAGPGHDVTCAVLIAARAHLADKDHVAIAAELRFLVNALIAAHRQLLESEPATLRRVSRYRRDDPANAQRLLDVLVCAYFVALRLEDDGAAQNVAVTRYSALYEFELALKLFTRLGASGYCPAFVERLRWIAETRFCVSDGVRAGAVLTSVLRELRDYGGARESLLPPPAQAALDAAIDDVVDTLAIGARASNEGDLEAAIAKYQACARRTAASVSVEPATRPLGLMLETELVKLAEADSRERTAELLRRVLLRVLSLTW